MSADLSARADIKDIIQVFVNGCTIDDELIQTVCAKSLNFLVANRNVYGEIEASGDEMQTNYIILRSPIVHVLDAIMILTGSDNIFIKATAFSTLSSLSTFSSTAKSVLNQIHRDIEIPEESESESGLSVKRHNYARYYQLIKNRLMLKKQEFCKRYVSPDIETKYSGLYSLLRLA